MTANIPYGSKLFVADKDKLKKGDVICKWDPYNAVIISEFDGSLKFNNLVEGVTYREEVDEQTGFTEIVIKENRDKKMIPTISVIDKSGEDLKSYNLPVDAHIIVKDGDKIKSGDIMVKILENQVNQVILQVDCLELQKCLKQEIHLILLLFQKLMELLLMVELKEEIEKYY